MNIFKVTTTAYAGRKVDQFINLDNVTRIYRGHPDEVWEFECVGDNGSQSFALPDEAARPLINFLEAGQLLNIAMTELEGPRHGDDR